MGMSLLVQKEWNLSFPLETNGQIPLPPGFWPKLFHILEIILGNHIAVELRQRQKW